MSENAHPSNDNTSSDDIRSRVPEAASSAAHPLGGVSSKAPPSTRFPEAAAPSSSNHSKASVLSEDPSFPSAASTDGSQRTHEEEEEYVEEEEVDDGTLLDLGFFFEGARATTPKEFEWRCGGNNHNNNNKRTLRVVLNCIDEEPGAVQSGHYLWPAAQLLVEFLIRQSAEQAATPSAIAEATVPVGSIVELGAGCALATLAALQLYRESLQVAICTDHDPGTCERARDNYESTLSHILDRSDSEDELNATINNLASIPVRFEPLEWGSDDLTVVQNHLRDHTVQESTTCDLVIGTDLIYCAAVVEPLLATAARLMHPKSGRFLLSQSFAYDDDAESAIDTACRHLDLKRTILWQDGTERRVQEFRHNL